MDKYKKLARIQERYRNPKNLADRFQAIRDAYEVMEITQAKGSDPYLLDWSLYETPIERMVWADTRGCGHDFLREYPVLNYFIDFANPENKIGIEADGAAFHDPERDLKRDTRLKKVGWTIYRLPGHLTTTDGWDDLREGYSDDWTQEERDECLKNYYTETSEGIVHLICLKEIYKKENEQTRRFSISHLRLV